MNRKGISEGFRTCKEGCASHSVTRFENDPSMKRRPGFFSGKFAG